MPGRRPLSPSLGHAVLVVRTARHLHAAQIAHRLRLRAQRAALGRFPGPLAGRMRRPIPARPGWPVGFAPLDALVESGWPGAEANAAGRFSFLAEERWLGCEPEWGSAGASRLWHFHLHGFEWAWAFVLHGDRAWASDELRRLWRSWQVASGVGSGDAWAPYVASIRAWALCGAYLPLVAGTDDDAAFVDGLARHAGFLRAHLELDVGGNHLVKNLKALVGLGLFLDDDEVTTAALKRLGRELPRQVLADGGHFERSPSYHCQVLGDLMDVLALLQAAGRAPLDGLAPAIAAMRAWLGAILLPDGDVPLFNDCTLVGTDRLARLAATPSPNAGLVLLGDSGYFVLRSTDGLHLVGDVGLPCPPVLPAHAHADCLSFELAVDGKRVVVDSGTSTYEAGTRRRHERSTAAHNTIEVDGSDQTEVWGIFRAARRATPRLERAVEVGRPGEAVEVVASHDGYRRLPGRPLHRRRWRVGPGRIEITDDVEGTGTHRLVARLHLAPGVAAVALDPTRVAAGPVQISVQGGKVDLDDAEVATGFGVLSPARRVSITTRGPLPLRIVTIIERLRDH